MQADCEGPNPHLLHSLLRHTDVSLTLNNGSLISDDGQELYILPVQRSISESVLSFFDNLQSLFSDDLKSSQFWIILILVVGFFAVALLLILLL